jgi:hypothetical protein
MMNINDFNSTPFILDALTRKAIKSDVPSIEFDAEQANKAMRLCGEIMDLFEKNDTGPVEAYAITGALSDALYAYLVQEKIYSN